MISTGARRGRTLAGWLEFKPKLKPALGLGLGLRLEVGQSLGRRSFIRIRLFQRGSSFKVGAWTQIEFHGPATGLRVVE